MTDPATAGDLPTIDQARAIAAAGLRVLPIKPGNDTRVVRRWYTQGFTHRSAGALLRSPRRDQHLVRRC